MQTIQQLVLLHPVQAIAPCQIFILSILMLTCFGQATREMTPQSGIEIQQYPTGFLFGLYHDSPISSRISVDTRVGYNLVRHGDAGVHSDERGGGLGASLGLKWISGSPKVWPRNAWLVGVRSDVWFNRIDWKDETDIGYLTGDSKVTVLQPTALIGYLWPFAAHWQIAATLALGAEINVKEVGGEVGDGMILLWGFRFTHLW